MTAEIVATNDQHLPQYTLAAHESHLCDETTCVYSMPLSTWPEFAVEAAGPATIAAAAFPADVNNIRAAVGPTDALQHSRVTAKQCLYISLNICHL